MNSPVIGAVAAGCGIGTRAAIALSERVADALAAAAGIRCAAAALIVSAVRAGDDRGCKFRLGRSATGHSRVDSSARQVIARPRPSVATGTSATRDTPGSPRGNHLLLKAPGVEVPTAGVEQLWNPRISSAPARCVEARSYTPSASSFRRAHSEMPTPLRLGSTPGRDPSSNFLRPCSRSVRRAALIRKRSKPGRRNGHIVG